MHADFFALGADSVLATTITARIHDWLDIDHAAVPDLLTTRTIAGLAQRLDKCETQRGRPNRLAMTAHDYLDITAIIDEESSPKS